MYNIATAMATAPASAPATTTATVTGRPNVDYTVNSVFLQRSNCLQCSLTKKKSVSFFFLRRFFSLWCFFRFFSRFFFLFGSGCWCCDEITVCNGCTHTCTHTHMIEYRHTARLTRQTMCSIHHAQWNGLIIDGWTNRIESTSSIFLECDRSAPTINRSETKMA